MQEIPRLNGVIKALEEGKTAFVGFAPVDIETASALANSSYDGIAFEMEYTPMSAPALRDALARMASLHPEIRHGLWGRQLDHTRQADCSVQPMAAMLARCSIP